MCGIVAAVAQNNISDFLLQGLKCLEYRGYDSSGIALLSKQCSEIHCLRTKGKIQELQAALAKNPIEGNIGIAHTRWATHGKPSLSNAHPHTSHDTLAIVHNGIIENHTPLKEFLETEGYRFLSETDSEVIAHLLHYYYRSHPDLLSAMQKVVGDLKGTFAIAALHREEPERLIAVRSNSPLVVGLGEKAHFIASDPLALLSATQRFISLQKGDIVEITSTNLTIYDKKGVKIQRPIETINTAHTATEKGNYPHYMLKEIFEQPEAIRKTLADTLVSSRISDNFISHNTRALLAQTKNLQIVACGTSYHAAMVARDWIENLAGIPCHVDIASEFRYRNILVPPQSLFITLSQSGETADTLAALSKAQQSGYLGSLTFCNVPDSLLVRNSDAFLLTQAGKEISVASTKSFTTQLVLLLTFSVALAQVHRHPKANEVSTRVAQQLTALCEAIQQLLARNDAIRQCAAHLFQHNNALFLARGQEYPIAMEGALKLKEITYIHAEAYPAGELKHGPLALIDENMPVIMLIPQSPLQHKLESTLEEIRARGGNIIVLTEDTVQLSHSDPSLRVLRIPPIPEETRPILYSIALQLLAYHTAVLKGTDVDQPRNLAKSVTVE